MRVALEEVRWPLPQRPLTRDERQLAAAVRAFEVVRARAGEVVVRGGPVRIVFREVEPHQAAVLFRRGRLDEAPVPVGDIRAALDDATVGDAVHVTNLAAVDGLRASRLPQSVRDALAATAARRDYAQLVPEDLEAAMPSPPARVFRSARDGVHGLPSTPVRIGVEGDPALAYGASLLAASWRDLDLDVHVVRHGANATFVRGSADGTIPIARAVDARFVSPRVRGWRENAQGVVAYARVRVR
ncbi:MAG: hypothetical protein ACJ74N_09020 [Gaiellaceae bacterium]